MAGEPCGENLHGQISEYVRILKHDRLWEHNEEATQKILRMILGAVKNRLAKFIRKGLSALSLSKGGVVRTNNI